MSTVFTINFRREAYQRELARTRKRLFKLGGWVTYFGVLALILGLYGLNCFTMSRQVAFAERRVTRAQQSSGARSGWKLEGRDLVTVESAKANPVRWRDRLARLAAILPSNVALASVAVNPENSTTPADQDAFVITGEMKVPPGSDRMRPVVQLVSVLQADSSFSHGYSSIRLKSSQAAEGAGNVTQFVIECR
jgi:hypothetical protein